MQDSERERDDADRGNNNLAWYVVEYLNTGVCKLALHLRRDTIAPIAGLAQQYRDEEKRRKEAVSIYRNAPQSARNALNVVKKVEARTEVGINFRDYSTVVGEAWAERNSEIS